MAPSPQLVSDGTMSEGDPHLNRPVRVVGRYALYGKLATGGMAAVHFGRLLGPVGFSRTVAIKRLHPQYAKDPEFVAMFLDEARLAARIQHPNVVVTLDVVAMDEELFLVMDYIRGESFSRLLRGARRQNITPPGGFIAAIAAGMLHGLHAAHEATDERGQPLKVVHRDVSPQNVLVGVDGVPRVLDFGVAKAAARIQVTRDGQMKGKLSYMSPEQLRARTVDRRSDIFAAGVVLWEALTGKRLFVGEDATEVLTRILKQEVVAPSSLNPSVSPQVDALVLRALCKDPDERFQTAREFAIAIEETMAPLSSREVGEWVEEIAGESLELRERALAEIESISSVSELSPVRNTEPSFLKVSPALRLQLERGAANVASRGVNFQPNPQLQPAQHARLAPSFADDAATTIYHGPAEVPLQQPLEPVLSPSGREVRVLAPPNFQGSTRASRFRARRGQLTRVGLALGALLLLVFGLVVWGKQQEPRAVPGARPHASPSPAPEASQMPASVNAAASSSAAFENSVLSLEKLPAAGDDGDRSLGESAARPAARRPAKPKRAARPAPSPARSSASPGSAGSRSRGCVQPWYVDENGIRRILTECL